MEITCIISAHTPLASAESCDHTQLHGSLGNVVKLSPMVRESSGVNGSSDNKQSLFCSVSSFDFGDLSLQINIAVMIPVWFSPGLAISHVDTRKAENINTGRLTIILYPS